MSALQASRKYGVPSRTLYDKVKKMGILTANMQKQLQQKKNTETPAKTDNGGNGLNSLNNFSPISLLGMQLPQSTLPTSTVTPVNGDPRQQALTSTEQRCPAVTLYYPLCVQVPSSSP